jgi:predicted hotdog family 3-hydroxylacyl-ACP dehydratase
MALHGALAGGAADVANGAANGAVDGPAAGASRVGLLAGVRDVRFLVLRLDDIESDLICEATHLAGDSVTALYEFALRDRDRSLLSGRASVILDAGGRLKI